MLGRFGEVAKSWGFVLADGLMPYERAAENGLKLSLSFRPFC